MLDRLYHLITFRSFGSLVALFVVVSLLLFNVDWVPRIQELSGLDLIDTYFAYSAGQLYQMLGAYGSVRPAHPHPDPAAKGNGANLK
jgi:hypothetical protein